MKCLVYIQIAFCVVLLAQQDFSQQISQKIQGIISQKIQDLEQNQNIRHASFALRKIGKPVVPSLIGLLKHKEARVQKNSMRILGHIGKPAQKAIPILVKLLKNKDIVIQRYAANALGWIGRSDPIVVAGLVQLFQVRKTAARSLTWIKPTAAMGPKILLFYYPLLSATRTLKFVMLWLKFCIVLAKIKLVLLLPHF